MSSIFSDGLTAESAAFCTTDSDGPRTAGDGTPRFERGRADLRFRETCLAAVPAVSENVVPLLRVESEAFGLRSELSSRVYASCIVIWSRGLNIKQIFSYYLLKSLLL